jgi:DNA-directed RNA polymerase subunit RPC12/RpoP
MAVYLAPINRDFCNNSREPNLQCTACTSAILAKFKEREQKLKLQRLWYIKQLDIETLEPNGVTS